MPVGGVRLLQARRQEDPQDVPDAAPRRRSGAMTPPGGPQEDAAGARRRPRSSRRRGVAGGRPQGADPQPLGRPVQAGRDPRVRAGAAAARAARARLTKRLSDVTRNDLQDFVDRLVAAGSSPRTIGVTLLPLRAIYKRALEPRRGRGQPDDRARDAGGARRPRPDRLARRVRAAARGAPGRRPGRCGRPRCTRGCGAAS